MVEMGHHEFIARTKLASEGAAHGVGKRRHVRAEDGFVRIAAQKICHSGAGVIDDRIGAAAGGVGAASVGIRCRQIIANGVDYALWDLRAAWAVEKDSRI